jgi:glucosaminylphosphatidylinositol acyltransferase
MTLGLLPLSVTFVKFVLPSVIPFSVLASLLLVIYEWALGHVAIRGYDKILAFIVAADRTDLFSQNREGIFSFIGESIVIFPLKERVLCNIPRRIRCREVDPPFT